MIDGFEFNADNEIVWDKRLQVGRFISILKRVLAKRKKLAYMRKYRNLNGNRYSSVYREDGFTCKTDVAPMDDHKPSRIDEYRYRCPGISQLYYEFGMSYRRQGLRHLEISEYKSVDRYLNDIGSSPFAWKRKQNK